MERAGTSPTGELFAGLEHPPPSPPTVIGLNLPDATVDLYRHAFPASEADRLFVSLLDTIAWTQERLRIYGKAVDLPRLTAWYGDRGTIYRYSGIRSEPRPWTPDLLDIKDRIETLSGCTFNSVLLNFYRNSRDSVSWHADDEKALGTNPVIGSVSFGAERDFQFKHKQRAGLKATVTLGHGSFLLMAGATQHHWLHQIPKSTRLLGPRINLTFRTIR